MKQYSDFGVNVRHRLIDKRMSLARLAELVHEDTGLYCDTPYLCRILRQERNSKTIIASIKKILEMNDD